MAFFRCGLIGHPLGHSCSPRVHELLGGPGYELWDTAPEKLDAFLREKNFDGINVTIPHKQAVIPYCDELGDTARLIGSVNTIVRRKDGTLFGDNTDAYGFLGMAKRAGIDFRGKKVLVLGSGGTSHTACAVIRSEGGTPIVISRSGENNYDNLYLHEDAQIVVNTTPVGMYPHVDAAPLDLKRLPCVTGVLDVIYNPLRTRLLQQAQEMGLKNEGGLYMLCAQAARARELFTGKKIADEQLDAAYRTLLAERQSIVLIGMPGCGKTTVGRILAGQRRAPYVDTDALIVEKAGKPIPQIFAGEGEVAFRNIEQQVVAECCSTGGQVVATGGGAILREQNRLNLRMNAKVVWIQRPLELLPFDGRPLSKGYSAVTDMYAVREPLYRACADVIVQNTGMPEETVAEILKSI